MNESRIAISLLFSSAIAIASCASADDTNPYVVLTDYPSVLTIPWWSDGWWAKLQEFVCVDVRIVRETSGTALQLGVSGLGLTRVVPIQEIDRFAQCDEELGGGSQVTVPDKLGSHSFRIQVGPIAELTNSAPLSGSIIVWRGAGAVSTATVKVARASTPAWWTALSWFWSLVASGVVAAAISLSANPLRERWIEKRNWRNHGYLDIENIEDFFANTLPNAKGESDATLAQSISAEFKDKNLFDRMPPALRRELIQVLQSKDRTGTATALGKLFPQHCPVEL